MSLYFPARVRGLCRLRHSPCREDKLEALSQRIKEDVFGFRAVSEDELANLTADRILQAIAKYRETTVGVFVDEEPAFDKLERANADLAKLPAPEREGAVPRKMVLSEKDSAGFAKLSAAHKLELANGSLLAPEFTKND